MLCMWAVLGAAAELCAAAVAGAAQGQAPRPRCAPAAARAGGSCRAGYQARQNSVFIVKGATVIYSFTEGDSFSLKCPPGVALDEPDLPRFESALRVRRVSLECPPPPGGVSYAAALHALNVTSLDAPEGGAGGAPTYLIKLYLDKVANLDARVLAAMPTLRNLTLFQTNITAAELALLPASLERLELRDSRVGRVPAAALERLPRLVSLVVNERATPVSVEAAGGMSSLTVSSRAALVEPALPDALRKLTLWGWAPRRPQPWRSCAGLDSLRVQFAAAETLPDGWLARCARLRVLRIETAENLTSLAEGALRGATALEVLWFSNCALEALPAGLLHDAPALREFDLTRNRLHTLPGVLFARSVSLTELTLSNNELTRAALGALRAAATLSELRLDHNAALDPCACGADDGSVPGPSPLRGLRNLTVLTLRSTGTRCVCADWRELPRLAQLTLSKTPITRLTSADLRFDSTVDVRLDLYSTNVTRLELSREDYQTAAGAGAALTLQLSEPLRCDCALYWAAAALRRPRTRLRAAFARCQDRRELRHVPLDELVCAAPGACPAGCACRTRGDAARAGPLLRLDCAGAGLRRVPRVDARAALLYSGAEPVLLDLRLAGNRIDRVGPEDLPHELTALDLRNNSLGLIDADTAAALVSRADRRVLLAGNPLNCSCRAAAVLAAVREHPDVFRDWADATCSDGTQLALVAASPCDDGADASKNVSESSTNPSRHTAPKAASEGMSAGSVAALVLCSAAAVALGLALMRPSVRRRLWRSSPTRAPSTLRLERRRPADDEWMYDAFVSFAHSDEAIVRELVEELEGGAAPLRLCVHYRDWMPGGWIPEQIAASVRVSRRTVAVVSEAFLRSRWARAEFREAYAATMEDGEPRLVLVLLEDPARLPLRGELGTYVNGNTYVRWGDPWFWRKLRRALPAPAPRLCRPVESAAASPSASTPAPLGQATTTVSESAEQAVLAAA